MMLDETNILEIVNLFRDRIDNALLDDLTSLVKHNEITIALENLCENLYEFEISLSENELNEAVQLCQMYNVSENYINLLKELHDCDI